MDNKKDRFSTFQIAKACGISRSSILRLEQEGFISPSFTEPSTGKRFYSFSDVARVIQVMTLRNFGLEKEIIHRFFNKHEDYQICLDVLQERLDNLTRIIRVVKIWQNASEDFHTLRMKVGALRCYAKKRENGEPLFEFLASTFEEVIKKGLEINISKTPFLQFFAVPGTASYEIYACIPVLEEARNNVIQMPSCRAIAIQWRGNAKDQPDMMKQIRQEAAKHGMTDIKEFRVLTAYDEFTARNISNDIKGLQFIIPEE